MCCQCGPHIETSQLIRCANQLTGFYMRVTLTFTGLSIQNVFDYTIGSLMNILQHKTPKICCKLKTEIAMSILSNSAQSFSCD